MNSGEIPLPVSRTVKRIGRVPSSGGLSGKLAKGGETAEISTKPVFVNLRAFSRS